MSRELALRNDDAQDLVMGKQLTAQFHLVTGQWRELLLFSAMMMKVEERIVSARGHVATGGPVSKGTGIKGWLDKYAPEVDRSTAYRLRDVGRAIFGSFESQIPLSLRTKITFESLVSSTEKELRALDHRLIKKQAELFAFAAGRSQRSWLDQFRIFEERGGHHPRKTKLTPAQLRAQAEKDAIESYETICRSLDRFLKDNAHTLLPKDLRVLFSSALGKTKRSLDAVAD